MAIIILSKKNLADHPWHKWLADADADLILIAEDSHATRDTLAQLRPRTYKEVYLFDEWKTNGLVDLQVMEVCRHSPVSHLVSSSECDVVRSARLRERLDLPGQLPASAFAFRDKHMTKQLLDQAGVDVPRYRLVGTAAELAEFVDEVGLPVVTKPRSGSGAMGVRRHDNVADALAMLAEVGDTDGRFRLLVEEYIEGRRLFVDGLTDGNDLVTSWVSAYDIDLLDALATGQSFGSATLDEGDPEANAATAYVRRVLTTLPPSGTPTAVHVEIFSHPDRGPLLCEVHARVGGGRIRSVGLRRQGIDLEREHVRGQAQLSTSGATWIRPQAFGWGHALRRGGRLSTISNTCPISGVVEHRVHAEVGNYIDAATKVSHTIADCLIEAESSAAAFAILDEWKCWVDSTTSWGASPCLD